MASLNETFSALGDPTRRAILHQLAAGETTLSELAQPFGMSQTAVSRHVRVLERAGLVRMEKRGRTRHCRLDAAPMYAAADWLQAYAPFWEEALTNLKGFIEEETAP